VNLSSPRFSRGVTLIELMAVVAAVAILASLAYPAYEEQMRKSRRTDAAGALTSLANAMERFQIANGTYVGAGTTGGDRSTGAPGIFPTQAPLDGERKYYDLRILSASRTDYVLAAIPLPGSPRPQTANFASTARGNAPVVGKPAGNGLSPHGVTACRRARDNPPMDPVTSIEIIRTADKVYRCNWSEAFGEQPVQVFAGATPGSIDFQSPLVTAQDGCALHGLPLPTCFALVPRHGRAVISGARHLALEGATNLRDIGGYAARDGRRVKWGLLFRSGHLSGLSAVAREEFASLGIRTVCDFRLEAERVHENALLPNAPKLSTIGVPPGKADQHFFHRLFEETSDPERVAAEIAALLRVYVLDFAEYFRRMFDTLLNHGQGGILLNCSAGKERTGVGVVLMLMALGVPRSTLRHEFLLSHRYFPIAAELGRVLRKYAVPSRDDASLTPLVMPLLETRESYADALFEALDLAIASCGGEDEMLSQRYGLGPEERRQLREKFTREE